MKIGFDAKRAFFNKTGLGNYSRMVIKSLCELYPENSCYLYTPKKPFSNPFADEHNLKIIDPLTPLVHSSTEALAKVGATVATTKAVNPSPVISAAWRSFLITHRLKQDGIDIYHGLSHELPFNIRKSGISSVVTVHDLVFMKFPQYYNAVDRMIYKIKLKSSCRNADKIIAISDQTKADLVSLLKIPKEKIKVVYQSCDDQFYEILCKETKDAVRTKYNLPPRFLLNVGTIEERKNLLLLVKAMVLLDPEMRIPLVVIGKKTSYFSQIQKFISANKLEKHVLFLNDVDFKDLPAIYQLADLFIYPSRYEGFGLPIVEALFSRIPVITSNSCGCLNEAGGPDSLYVDPDNEKDLASKINKILGDVTFANNMRENGLVYVQRFHKSVVTKNLMRVYNNLAG